jgi:hydrogenase nickel incorporation protein HypB
MDMAAAAEFDQRATHQNIQAVRPGMQIFELSVKSGAGIDAFLGFLESRLAESRQEQRADTQAIDATGHA